MQSHPFLKSAAVIRRVHAEMVSAEQVHRDVRDLTDMVYEQTSPLHSLVEQVEHGMPKITSWRSGSLG